MDNGTDDRKGATRTITTPDDEVTRALPRNRPAAETFADAQYAAQTAQLVTHRAILQVVEDDVPAEWRVGDVILDMYEVTDVFGEGASAYVYKVYHRHWDLDLAVKTPKSEMLQSSGGIDNFIREAETWVNLGLHPHIVSCYYVRRLGGIPRLFAEFVGGGTLESWIRDRSLYRADAGETPLARMLDIAIQTARGLAYAHAQGLIHQDVKPTNVMMTPAGVAKVTDFGLAKARCASGTQPVFDGRGGAMVTCGGMTPAYCSPEQAAIVQQAMDGVRQAERGKLTLQTDIWSWAVMVLEMFTGEVSWQFGQHVDRKFAEYGAAVRGIPPMPPRLRELLGECFARDPDRRPPGLDRVADELAEIYRETCAAAYPRPAPRAADVLADNLNNRAVSLMDIGQSREAEACWQQALKTHPHHPEASYNCGLYLWRRGRLCDEELAREMEEVRQGQARDWKNNYLLGLVLLERGDYEQALRMLAAVTEISHSKVDMQRPLGAALERIAHSRKLLKSFAGHDGPVQAVCLSPDGRRALSGGGEHFSFGRENDCSLRLWDLDGGGCLQTFEGHTGRIASVCFSPSGSYCLSAGADATVRLWEVKSGRCLRTFAGHGAMVSAACFQPGGRLILSGSREGTLKLWDPKTGVCLHTLSVQGGKVNAVCFMADGRYCLSGSEDGTLRVWDLKSAQCLGTLEGHDGPVTAVSVDHAAETALSASIDATLKLWDLHGGTCLRTMRGHKEAVLAARLSPDGGYAVSGGGDMLGKERSVRLWSVRSGRCLYTFEGHAGIVTSVCFSDDGRFVLSGSEDRMLKLWQVDLALSPYPAPMVLSRLQASEETLSIQHAYESAMTAARAALHAGDFRAALVHLRAARGQPGYARSSEAFGCWQQLYRRFPKQGFLGGWEQQLFTGHDDAVRCVLRAPGDLVITGSDDATVRLWHGLDGTCTKRLEAHAGSVLALALDPPGRYFYSASGDATVKRWSFTEDECLLQYAGHREGVFALALSGDGRYLLSGGEDTALRLWDADSGRCLREFAGHAGRINAVCLSDDGRFAISASSDHSIRLWDMPHGRCLSVFEERTDAILSLALCCQLRLLASGSANGLVQLWDIETGRCTTRLEGHAGGVNSVALSIDGCYALSAGDDRTVRLWDAREGTCLRVFEGHAYGVHNICAAGDMGCVLSAGRDGVGKLWSLDWDMLPRAGAEWDVQAGPYLTSFLACCTPYAADLPAGREPTAAEISAALSRSGTPCWSEAELDRLMVQLADAGLGWLSRQGVENKITSMAQAWQGPPLLAQFSAAAALEGDNPTDPIPESDPENQRSRLILDID